MSITVPPRPLTNMTGFTADEPLSGTPVLVAQMRPEECFGVANSMFVLGTEDRVQAVTDRGTPIPLVHYEAVITPEIAGTRRFNPERDLAGFLAMLEEQFVERIKPPHCRLQRVQELNPACNCHGWTFAGGQFGIQDKYVPVILQEHGYAQVREPQTGDITVYSAAGRMVHSGIVRLTVPGHEILVESKWGPFGVFVHVAEAHPGQIAFYRTQRPGDMLKLVAIGE